MSRPDERLVVERGGGGQFERRALEHGVFTSVRESRKAIEAFIRAHDKRSAKPFKWTNTAEKITVAVDAGEAGQSRLAARTSRGFRDRSSSSARPRVTER